MKTDRLVPYPLSVGPSQVSRDVIARRLEEVRARTLALIAPLAEEDLRQQHDPLMSPILWDLGHIAHFEELWLVEQLGRAVQFGEMPGMYNPFEHPRRVRGELPLPTLAGCLREMEEIRGRVLDGLASVDLSSEDPLLHDGYVYAMVLQHECQHNETILQTLQLKRGAPYRAPRQMLTPRGAKLDGMVRFPGGAVQIGTTDRGAAYDNERPRHERVLAPFLIDVAPVSNGDYLEFMAAGGYSRREWWTDAGWTWLHESKVDAPKYWQRDGSAWLVRAMDRLAPVDPQRPVCHVCYHEAEAFARFAGKRLPTEYEWEVAASWSPDDHSERMYPWGHEPADARRANVDAAAFETAQIGAYEANRSPLGCYGMIGDTWEWTSSDFAAYPGYESFPYKEYSEVFFGSEYKVLRGASWATSGHVARNSFRNWDYPIRRQIFSGFRCARDD